MEVSSMCCGLCQLIGTINTLFQSQLESSKSDESPKYLLGELKLLNSLITSYITPFYTWIVKKPPQAIKSLANEKNILRFWFIVPAIRDDHSHRYKCVNNLNEGLMCFYHEPPLSASCEMKLSAPERCVIKILSLKKRRRDSYQLIYEIGRILYYQQEQQQGFWFRCGHY